MVDGWYLAGLLVTAFLVFIDGGEELINPLTTGWPYGDDLATQPVIVSQGENLCIA